VKKRLVDTNLWIQLSKGEPAALAFLAAARREGTVACSVVNRMEAVRGATPKHERRLLDALFASCVVIGLEKEDGWQAERIVRVYSQAHGIIAIDALIAAAAIRKGMVLSTLNDKHFRGIHGLQVERPY